MKTCKQCGKKLVGRDQKKFCGNSCSATYNNKKRQKKTYDDCLFCSAPLNNKVKIFCDNTCQQRYKQKIYIEEWYIGIRDGCMSRKDKRLSNRVRNHLLEINHYRCSECGWNKMARWQKRPALEIHHIDGNNKNHRPDNLQVLCPNCHALTPNYGNQAGIV